MTNFSTEMIADARNRFFDANATMTIDDALDCATLEMIDDYDSLNDDDFPALRNALNRSI